MVEKIQVRNFMRFSVTNELQMCFLRFIKHDFLLSVHVLDFE